MRYSIFHQAYFWCSETINLFGL